MRWGAQRLDFEEPSTLPGVPDVRGLLRSVQVPEFPGLTLHEVRCKSALNAVPKSSAMPFGHTINTFRGCSHTCVYCVGGDTNVLTADGRQVWIADLRVGDRIIGTERRGRYRYYVETEVLAHWSTVKPAHRLRLADGTAIVASGDHRFLTGRGWKHVMGTGSGAGQRPHLTLHDELLGFGRSSSTPAACADYRRGYLTGMVRGDGHLATYRYARAGRAHGDVHRRWRTGAGRTASPRSGCAAGWSSTSASSTWSTRRSAGSVECREPPSSPRRTSASLRSRTSGPRCPCSTSPPVPATSS
ncbi:hypothetical protein [Modestobacter lapidis]